MKNFTIISYCSWLKSDDKGQEVINTVPCDWMGLVVNVSDTNIVDIYHSGHYLTTQENIMFIEVQITRVMLLLKRVF